jgi:subtilisin family serine protease
MNDDNEKAAARRGRNALGVFSLFCLAACAPGPSPPGNDPPAGAAAPPPVVSNGLRAGSGDLAERRVIVPGEYLVKFRSTAAPARTAKILRDGALRTIATFRSVPGLQVVRVANGGSDPARLMKTLAQDRDVEYIEPNFVVHMSVVPNDPHYWGQWALNNTGQTGGNSPYHPHIDAEAAWDITTGSDDIVVAVVDTGVDYTHEDLAANIFRNEPECDGDGVDDDANGFVDDCHGFDAVSNDSDPMDEHFHGTHVAGTIGAVGNNGIGVAGVAWHVKIMPCRILNESGEGTTANAVACFDYLALMKDRGVNLLASNHSWSGPIYSRALQDAIAAHRARGMLVVAAAGNLGHDNDAQPGFPCNDELSNTICVASTTSPVRSSPTTAPARCTWARRAKASSAPFQTTTTRAWMERRWPRRM